MRIIITLVLMASLVMTGCGVQSRSADSSSLAEYARAEMPQEAVGLAAAPADSTVPAKATALAGDAGANAVAGTPGTGGLVDLAASQPDVYLIKNATVTLEVDDARTASTALIGSLQSTGAYVSNLNEYADALGRRTITLQVRVPAEKFDQSMSGLETLGRVLNKQVTTEDVTEEYVDTESRTRNLKKTEERLIDHLNRAAQLEDILRVENELTRVREQIERMEGRLRFLKNRVSFSTIGVTIQETAKAEPFVPAQSFSTAKEFSEAMRSLIGFLQGLWSRVIWIIVWLPVYGAIAGVAYWVYRRTRKQMEKLNL
jgi:hypothetical protein